MNEEAGSRRPRPTVSRAIPRQAVHERQASLVDEEFAAFYRLHVKRLVAFLINQNASLSLVAFLINQNASLSDAADIAQATMEKLYQRWSEIGHHRAWAYKVASRELIRKFSDTRESPVEELPEPSSLLPRPDGVSEWESRYDALRVLRTLPPRQRQILAWTLSDFTPAEISQQLGLSCEAVRASLKKARQTATALVREWEET
ncbi:RNA polymerase sigma factor [Streptomyces endophyticus]|uniref:Sigma-70 family RNA polymerase sigma factor n=1 Tax=Streptomyces endophyticus TaxID=714166 RepID=A0ABU6FF80_9ACTN|nr:sigma-70 family RNA polymerase sigma factor [Streptomyces endophyticus]MEB8342118.1 sigma-70 family RNA polymerase sigma factor [Streptomyces endophyticus]